MSTKHSTQSTNDTPITVPGARINLAGDTVRDLIDALRQLDPGTKTNITAIRCILGSYQHVYKGDKTLQLTMIRDSDKSYNHQLV